MQRTDFVSDDQTVEHFRVHGWMRVAGAFSADEAAAMCAAVWRSLSRVGIREGEPSTWTTERPEHLQQLKKDSVFRAPWSPRTRKAIEAVLARQPIPEPTSCGAFFIAFPSRREWSVPAGGWHIDANYTSALSPPDGVKLHAAFGDIAPRGGATLILSGSHRLVHKWFEENPPLPGAHGADHRKSLQNHPYIGDLHRQGDTNARIVRFMERVEEVDGIPLQVVENTGSAGDVILVHPLVLHVASTNARQEPRFLLSGGVDTQAMWGKLRR